VTEPTSVIEFALVRPFTSAAKDPQIVDEEIEGTPLHAIVNSLPPLPLLWEILQLSMDIAALVVMSASPATTEVQMDEVVCMVMVVV